MPLGDPQGGLFEYTDEGLPECIFACSIPVKDIAKAIPFYTDVLGMEVLGSDDCHAYLIRGGCRMILKKSSTTGIDTGLYIGVDSPYNTRRRLIDENIVFVQDPVRSPFGTTTSFLDNDENIIHVIETRAEFKL